MLQQIRDKITGWFAALFLGAIAVVFIFWGVQFESAVTSAAATVNGKDISQEAVRRAWQDRQTELQTQRRDELPPELVKSEQVRLLDDFIARELLVQRHGDEDFTLFTQEDMLATLNKILNMLKFAIGAIGGVALVVGGVGVLTIMSSALAERTEEIGLLRGPGLHAPAGAGAVPGRGGPARGSGRRAGSRRRARAGAARSRGADRPAGRDRAALHAGLASAQLRHRPARGHRAGAECRKP